MRKGGAFLDCLICFQFGGLKVKMCNIPIFAGFHYVTIGMVVELQEEKRKKYRALVTLFMLCSFLLCWQKEVN